MTAPTAPHASHTPHDPLATLLGGSPLLSVLSESKPEVLAHTREAYSALYADAHPLPAPVLHALAAVVAAQQGSAELYAHHRAAGADASLLDAALAGEDLPDPVLAAVFRHADIVSVSPALAEPEDQEHLMTAGIDPDLVVLLGQLVSFESYLIRLVAGARALADAYPGTADAGTAESGAAESGITEVGTAEASAAAPADAPESTRVPASRGRDGQRSDRTREGRLRPTAFTQKMLEWEPWVPAPAADELTEEQIASFAAKSGTGNVYFRLISRTPGVTKARSALDNEVFLSKAGLPKGERELAAAVSSKVNDCVYCASVHARKATQRTKREEDVDRVLAVTLPRDTDWVASSVEQLADGQDERWTVLVETAARLAALRPEFTAADVARLRGIGLGDLEIADLVASTAFFGWANRLMLTLGEPYWPEAE
ncbi:peroxidase-related enzyme [Brevibacterium sp.]|uniref:peroxidase-related enzyme n=1 Tax=Brevibacterium sp. TaxID=1701 RepID=UPI0025B7F357|nr:peroxidase-related enzyme [Brevibacterium sp.]